MSLFSIIKGSIISTLFFLSTLEDILVVSLIDDWFVSVWRFNLDINELKPSNSPSVFSKILLSDEYKLVVKKGCSITEYFALIE